MHAWLNISASPNHQLNEQVHKLVLVIFYSVGKSNAAVMSAPKLFYSCLVVFSYSALLDRFMEVDLGLRDEWLLSDWIKRGHRWKCPSVDSSPDLPCLVLLKSRTSGRVVVEKPRHIFWSLLSQPSTLCVFFSFSDFSDPFAFPDSLQHPWPYITVQQLYCSNSGPHSLPFGSKRLERQIDAFFFSLFCPLFRLPHQEKINIT